MDLRIPVDDAALAEFCRTHDIRRLAFFGSVLTDRFSSESDVDVLVTFREDARVSLLTLARAQRELSELLGHDVDLVPEGSLKPEVADAVRLSAVVAYAA